MTDIERNIENNKRKLLTILNKILELQSLDYYSFNIKVDFGDNSDQLSELEKVYPEIGLAYVKENEGYSGISTLSLIATVTEILTGDRLAFETDMETGEMTKVSWLYENREKIAKESNA